MIYEQILRNIKKNTFNKLMVKCEEEYSLEELNELILLLRELRV